MLSKVGDTQTSISRHMTSLGLQISRQQLDHGRFTGTVGTNDGDTTVERHIDVDAVQDLLADSVGKADLVELQQRRRDLFWIGEFE